MANGCREDVDTALLKLYAEQDQDCLLDLLSSNNACLLADSVPWLEKYHKCGCVPFFLSAEPESLALKVEDKPTTPSLVMLCLIPCFLRYFALGLLYHYNCQDSTALQVGAAEMTR